MSEFGWNKSLCRGQRLVSKPNLNSGFKRVIEKILKFGLTYSKVKHEMCLQIKISKMTTFFSQYTTLLSRLTTLLSRLVTFLSRLTNLLSRLTTLLSWLITLLSRPITLLSRPITLLSRPITWCEVLTNTLNVFDPKYCNKMIFSYILHFDITKVFRILKYVLISEKMTRLFVLYTSILLRLLQI